MHLMRRILRVTANETSSRFFARPIPSIPYFYESFKHAPPNAASIAGTRELWAENVTRGENHAFHRRIVWYGIDTGNFLCVQVEKMFAEKCVFAAEDLRASIICTTASRGKNEWVIYRRCYRMCDMRTCACQPCVGTREDNAPRWTAISMDFAFPQTGYLV